MPGYWKTTAYNTRRSYQQKNRKYNKNTGRKLILAWIFLPAVSVSLKLNVVNFSIFIHAAAKTLS